MQTQKETNMLSELIRCVFKNHGEKKTLYFKLFNKQLFYKLSKTTQIVLELQTWNQEI